MQRSAPLLAGIFLFLCSGRGLAAPRADEAATEQSPAPATQPPIPPLRLASPELATPAMQTGLLEELQRQLRLRDELLARHDREIAELRATLRSLPPARPASSAGETVEPWYNRLQLRGYLQFRYNQLPSGAGNENLINEQGDKSIGKNGGIYLRRARLILFGDVHPRLSIYIQPDFASAISDQLNVGILRDLYADVFLDRKKEFRLRIGQSKVPFPRGPKRSEGAHNRGFRLVAPHTGVRL
jgi:hypothetical protein